MRPVNLLWLLLVPALTGAEIYRWVDENGVVNYTQRSPDGVEAQRIVTRSGAPSVAVAVEVTPEPEVAEDPNANLSPEQQAMLEKLEKAEEERQAEIARIMQSNCDRAQKVLDRLSAKGRIRVRDENGNETAMTEVERESRISQAQRDVVQFCVSTS
jgi:hypothetical protein